MSNAPIITPAQQAMYALGEFAGLSASQTGNDLDHATYEAICTALGNAAGTIGTWSVVWGPSVVAQPVGSAVAMNTMYVAQSAANPSQYVIGIAGTNPKSMLDWIIEDGLVSWQVPWVYAILEAPRAKIALGTAIGLAILQNMKPSSTVPGSGTTLRDFLATITTSPVQIAVAGHSLGGALAPTVALWLADTQGFLSHWDPHKNATVSAMPTAGPTAGNREFAAYSGTKLGARLTPFYNTLDVVPHAWKATMLEQIPTLYKPHIPNLLVVDALVALALRLSVGGHYETLPGLTPLAGTFKNAGGSSDLERFLLEVAYQHTIAYYGWFNFNPSWLPALALPLAPPSPALIAALSSRFVTPSDAHAAAGDAPRTIAISGTTIDAPTSPSDPRGTRAVDLVTAELQRHAAPGAPTGR